MSEEEEDTWTGLDCLQPCSTPKNTNKKIEMKQTDNSKFFLFFKKNRTK